MISESAEMFAMVLYEEVDQRTSAWPNLWLCGEIIEYPSEEDDEWTIMEDPSEDDEGGQKPQGRAWCDGMVS